MRIGHGYDVHRFGGEGPLVLGGVVIPHDQGLVAHSDGDVVIHALCDALLGAAALGDLGAHFPDSDEAFRGIAGDALLRRVQSLLADNRYALANADVTIIAEAPRMAPHVAAMRDNLAAGLGVEPQRISVKATTHEKMGCLGRGEGVAVHAVALLDNE